MGQDVFDDFPFIHLRIGNKIAGAHGPHHDPHGNEEHGGIEDSQGVIKPLCDGIAQKTAHGHDGAVLEYLFPLGRVAVKEKVVQNQAQHLTAEHQNLQ